MKNIISIAAATGILFMANSALACTSDTPDEWECLIEDTANPATATNLINQGKQGPYTFSGTTKLKAGLLSATCDLTLNGLVEMQDEATSGVPGGVVFIEVTGGSIGGGGTCSILSLGNFPWEATLNGTPGIPGANGGDISPPYIGSAVADMSGIEVQPVGCSGTLPNISFNNGSSAGDPSYFEFNGSFGGCSVEGTLLAVDGDVDAW